ncbi:hypothetical protein FRC19_002124 [Serendipita sp. 401]|nr:hypothetical protein FRC19_002124 [Serendipita sp. 401]
MVVLKHLNEDTSWLVSFSYNDTTATSFNILIDPWLKGPQTDYWKLFSTQWHTTPSCVEHVADLGVEIHAVVISHEWTDHCHKATLLEVSKAVPVYATDKAAEIIRSWNHFSAVHTIPALPLGKSWRTTSSVNGLPPQIGIFRATSSESDFQYYHSAICIAYEPETKRQSSQSVGNGKEQDANGDGVGENGERGDKDEAHCIVYTPHGIPWASLQSLETSGIRQISALLHGLHEVTNPKVLGGKLNLGGRNAVQVAHHCKPKLWVGTHDEVKRGTGLVAKVLKRRIWTVEEALKEEGLVEASTGFKTLQTGEEIEVE